MEWGKNDVDYFGNEIEQDGSYVIFDASCEYADIVKNDREELIKYLVDIETDLADKDTTLMTRKDLFNFIAEVFDNDYFVMYRLGDKFVNQKEYRDFIKMYDPKYQTKRSYQNV